MKTPYLKVVVCGLLTCLAAHSASGDVLNMGGTRNADGSWDGLASLETVPVGDPGNAPDRTGYGAVGYPYNIGKYEVTAGQYTAFLNAVAATDTNGLYNAHMANTSYGSGITRTGASGSYSYSVAGDVVNRPVNYVSFWNGCRFANWLQNGQPSGLQSNSTTEDGAYTLTPEGMTNNTITRNGNWQWALPSENEWYKAAHYRSGGTNAGYWFYPTKSNTAPGQNMADPTGNNANYSTSPYAWPIDNGYYTTVVGEFQNSASAYGTFDQGGNVWEWNDTIPYSSYPYSLYRGARGGSFNDGGGLHASPRNDNYPTLDSSSGGFRVVQVPEPATLSLLALGGLFVARRQYKRDNVGAMN